MQTNQKCTFLHITICYRTQKTTGARTRELDVGTVSNACVGVVQCIPTTEEKRGRDVRKTKPSHIQPPVALECISARQLCSTAHALKHLALYESNFVHPVVAWQRKNLRSSTQFTLG